MTQPCQLSEGEIACRSDGRSGARAEDADQRAAYLSDVDTGGAPSRGRHAPLGDRFRSPVGSWDPRRVYRGYPKLRSLPGPAVGDSTRNTHLIPQVSDAQIEKDRERKRAAGVRRDSIERAEHRQQ